ncbi:hypothetical protein A2U01_0067359, partial [Trifolium medium]|nr:hypothetical protein [Trifolium medium]
MTWKYFNEFESGPVEDNVAEDHGEEAANVGDGNDQGPDDVMEEIDRFNSGAVPNQQQQSGDWPYTHSEHEVATLLHNMDINTHFRLPNLYCNTQGMM